MGRRVIKRRFLPSPLADLVLSGWWEAPYHYAQDSDPWLGSTSAGDSDEIVLSYNGSPTDLGPGLNGYASAQFEGVHNSIFCYYATGPGVTPARIDRVFSRTGYGGAILLKPDEVNAPQPGQDARASRGIWQDADQTKLGSSIDTTDGITLNHSDGGPLKTAAIGYVADDFAVYLWGFDGTQIWIRRNRGARVYVSAGPIVNPFDGTGTFHVGDNWGGGGSDEAGQSHFSGEMLDILTARQPFTSDQELAIVDALETKYSRGFDD